ncbi:MAG: Succinylglutamate desuccinylase [Myxococcaceae bacterium]|nr:Succinylglutamate desuccinylase [Myxococcaceae bacterium]
MPPSPLSLDRREIGRHVGAAPGPSVVAVAGVHGNEPAGIEAARRVFARLERGDVAVRGELVVFAGNVASLRRGVRYETKDLNRQWSEARVAALRAQGWAAVDAEDREQVELLGAIEAALGRARGAVTLADLHTSSAAGVPFILFGDTLAQRRFVGAFPLPVIIGLEEQVDGALTEYWTRRGCVTFTVEGGQHDDPASVDSLEAVLWIALSEAGVIDGAALPEVRDGYAALDARRGDLPRVLEVVSRRAITAEDTFQMEPGFRNIARARAGQLLARDRRGEIVAPHDGLVILPLYQGLGSDGFFWGREVSAGRLRASRVLRALGVDRLLALLPGVARDPRTPSRFVVDTQVARLFPLEVFHLFGYRRVRERGGKLTVERQLD